MDVVDLAHLAVMSLRVERSRAAEGRKNLLRRGKPVGPPPAVVGFRRDGGLGRPHDAEIKARVVLVRDAKRLNAAMGLGWNLDDADLERTLP